MLSPVGLIRDPHGNSDMLSPVGLIRDPHGNSDMLSPVGLIIDSHEIQTCFALLASLETHMKFRHA